MGTKGKFSDEVCKRTVRPALDHIGDYETCANPRRAGPHAATATPPPSPADGLLAEINAEVPPGVDWRAGALRYVAAEFAKHGEAAMTRYLLSKPFGPVAPGGPGVPCRDPRRDRQPSVRAAREPAPARL